MPTLSLYAIKNGILKPRRVFFYSADQGGEAASLLFVFHHPHRQIKPTVDTEVRGGAHGCQDFLLRLPNAAEVCSACDVKSV